MAAMSAGGGVATVWREGVMVCKGREVRLRPGPEIAPGPEPTLLGLVWDTDPHLFAYLFGKDRGLWDRLFRAEWAADQGLHRAADTIVATAGDGAVLGLASAFAGPEADARAEASFGRYMASLDPVAAAALAEAAGQMAWLFPTVPDDALLIFNIVVAEDARGLGLGAALLGAAEAVARGKGLAALHLDVEVSNPAVGFYQRHGFRPVVETRLAGPGTATVPPHYRMILTLTG